MYLHAHILGYVSGYTTICEWACETNACLSVSFPVVCWLLTLLSQSSVSHPPLGSITSQDRPRVGSVPLQDRSKQQSQVHGEMPPPFAALPKVKVKAKDDMMPLPQVKHAMPPPPAPLSFKLQGTVQPKYIHLILLPFCKGSLEMAWRESNLMPARYLLPCSPYYYPITSYKLKGEACTLYLSFLCILPLALIN